MENVSDILDNILKRKSDLDGLDLSEIEEDILNIEIEGNRLCFWVSSPVVKLEIERRSDSFLKKLKSKNVYSVVVFIGRDQ